MKNIIKIITFVDFVKEIMNVINVHRSSFVKHLRSKKHLEIENQNELILPEWLFKEEQALIKKQKNIYKPKTLKQIVRENIKMSNKD